MKKRLLASLLSMMLVFSLVPTVVFATGTEGEIVESTEVAETVEDTNDASGEGAGDESEVEEEESEEAGTGESSGAITAMTISEGEPEEDITAESVQALINALPDADEITADNAAEVEAALDAIDEAKNALYLAGGDVDSLNMTKYQTAVDTLTVLAGGENSEEMLIESAMTGTCGAEGNENNVTWTLTSNGSVPSTYTLTISGTGAMADYALNGTYESTGAYQTTAPWYIALTPDSSTGLVPITEIVIEDGVTYVGYAAFGSLAITEISFSSSVEAYGYYAFASCKSATTVDWTGFNSSIDTVPYGMLYGCSSVEYFKVGSTTSDQGALLLPETIKKIGTSSFANCTALTSIDMTDIEQIGNNAFGGCTAITTIILPETVDDPDDYFVKACFVNTGITTVTLPSNITVIPESLFRNCASLESIEIPDSVKSIGIQAFSSCTSLTEVIFGEGSQLETIGKWAFNKTKITSFDMPDTVTTISDIYAFGHTTELTYIHISDSLTGIPESTFDLSGSETSKLTTIDIDADNAVLTSIGNKAMYGSAIESIVFPSTLTSIGNSALYNCVNLYAIDLTRVSADNITFGNTWCYYSVSGAVNRVIYVADTNMIAKFDGYYTYGNGNEHTAIAVTNGGIFEAGDDGMWTYTSGKLDSPFKVGYTFEGWYTSEDFADNTYVGKNITFNAKTTYYAKYSENSYTAENATIRENSSNTATLNAPTNLTYDGTGKEASVTYSDNWGSGKLTIVYYDSDGNLLEDAPVDAGEYTAKITVTDYSGEESEEVTAETTFTIVPKEITASISGTTEKIYDGTTAVTSEQELSITLSGIIDADTENVYASAGSYAYDSANVGSNRSITANTVTLNGDAANNYKLTSNSTTVSASISEATPTVSITYEISKSYDTLPVSDPIVEVTLVGSDSYSGVPTITYYSVADDGTEKELASAPSDVGNYKVKVTISDAGDNYQSAYVSASFTITGDDQDVTITGYTNIPYDGQSHEVTVEADSDATVTVTYTDADGNTVSAPVNVGTYTAHVIVTKAGYNTVEQDVTVSIAKAVQSISYETTSVTKTVGEDAFTNTLTQTTVYGTITYASNDTDVATVDGNGKVTIVGAGTATISATVSGSDNYTSAMATYTLVVNAETSNSDNGSNGDNDSSDNNSNDTNGSSDSSESNSGSSSSNSSGTTGGTSTTSTPQTGDSTNIFLWIVLLALAASGITVTIIYGRKRNYNK